MEAIIERYYQIISELDPTLSPQEIIESSPEDMLYNLLNIKEDADIWNEDDPGLYEELLATIEQFKAAGVEII